MAWGKKRKSKPIVIMMFIAMLLQCMPLVTLAGINSTVCTAAVGEWHFDEGTGRIAEDTSGNGNDGTIDDAFWVDGKKGAALSFNGICDYVEIPHDPLLSPNTALTVEAWVNPASNTLWQRVVSKSYHPNTDYSLFRGDKNNIGFSIKMGTVIRSIYSPVDSVPIGTWTYVVGTYDGTRMRLYVNGTQVNSLAISGKINVHAEPLRIGGDPQGGFFKGMIDEVGIYNKALTAAEILSRYEAALQEETAVGEWKLDEGTGTIAEDNSGNGNNGTIGGAAWVDGKKGTALSFDGINDYVEIPHDVLFNPNKTLTLEAWVNPASNTLWQRVVSKSYHPNTDYSLFRGDKNNIGFSIKMGTVIRSIYSPADSVPIGTWTYVVGTYDGTRMRLYVNGTQVNSFAISGKINVHAEPLRIGGDPQGGFFKGMIDEVSIFNRALTAEEVLCRYEDALFKTQAKLAAGRNVSALLKENGTVWASGFNGHGQLGDGTRINRYEPVQAKGLEGVVAISAGYDHTLALNRAGTVWAWGSNAFGELGDGTTIERHQPVQVKGLEGVVAISAGDSYSLALKEDGTVWAWGAKCDDYSAEIKTWTPITEPVQVQSLQDIAAIAAGSDYNLVVKKDGTVWGWGDNKYGQLGNGTTTPSIEPVQVGLEGVVAISTSIDHSIALKEDGTLWAWGSNHSGQLGDGTRIIRTEPVQVGLEGVVAISTGYSHSLALKEDRTVWAWGDNYYGQLGDGTQINRTEPVLVQGLEEVVEISGGYMHSLAIKPDGTVWAWGYNGFGSFGDGTANSSNLPMDTGNKIK